MTERHHERLRPIEPHRGFTVLLSAWPPARDRHRRPDDASPTQRHDALVGVARAVFALGGELVVPADPDTAAVIAAVALDYAPLPTAERHEAPAAPLTLMETQRVEPHLRAMMTPYVALGAVHYVDPDGRSMPGEREWASYDLRELESVRHPVTSNMLRHFKLRGAIFISPTHAAEPEMAMLAEQQVPVAVLSATVDDPQLAETWSPRDPTRDLVRPERRHRWAEREEWHEREEPRERRRPLGDRVPYAFVAQRLILNWARGGDSGVA